MQAIPITFVLRVTVGESGRLTGILEQVSTGAKARIDDLAILGTVIARMVEAQRRRRGDIS